MDKNAPSQEPQMPGAQFAATFREMKPSLSPQINLSPPLNSVKRQRQYRTWKKTLVAGVTQFKSESSNRFQRADASGNAPPPVSSAERQRRYRERKKALRAGITRFKSESSNRFQQADASVNASSRMSSAERQRRYRARQKALYAEATRSKSESSNRFQQADASVNEPSLMSPAERQRQYRARRKALYAEATRSNSESLKRIQPANALKVAVVVGFLTPTTIHNTLSIEREDEQICNIPNTNSEGLENQRLRVRDVESINRRPNLKQPLPLEVNLKIEENVEDFPNPFTAATENQATPLERMREELENMKIQLQESEESRLHLLNTSAELSERVTSLEAELVISRDQCASLESVLREQTMLAEHWELQAQQLVKAQHNQQAAFDARSKRRTSKMLNLKNTLEMEDSLEDELTLTLNAAKVIEYDNAEELEEKRKIHKRLR